MARSGARHYLEPSSIDVKIEKITDVSKLKQLLTAKLPHVRYRDRDNGRILQVIPHPHASYEKARDVVERTLAELFDD